MVAYTTKKKKLHIFCSSWKKRRSIKPLRYEVRVCLANRFQMLRIQCDQRNDSSNMLWGESAYYLVCYHSGRPLAFLPPSRALGGALFMESTAMYCPQVCNELVNHGRVRILATGTLILCTGGVWGS